LLNHSGNNGETHDAAFYRSSERVKPSTGQSRGNLADVAWLAGIVDGEGHIGLSVEPKRPNSIRTVLLIGNTSQAMLEKVQRIVFELTHRKLKVGFAEPAGYAMRTKDWYQFPIYAQKDLVRVCEAILPHLTCKRVQAEIMIEFCRLRQSKKHIPNAAYGPEEMALIKRMEPFRKKPYPKKLTGVVETESAAPQSPEVPWWERVM
jgi:hypothetical protein